MLDEKNCIIFKPKRFFLNVHLLAEKNILNILGKIQSVNFSTVNNISKFYENLRQKSSAGVGGLTKTKEGSIIDTLSSSYSTYVHT